jgi:hypothetical protein
MSSPREQIRQLSNRLERHIEAQKSACTKTDRNLLCEMLRTRPEDRQRLFDEWPETCHCEACEAERREMEKDPEFQEFSRFLRVRYADAIKSYESKRAITNVVPFASQAVRRCVAGGA